MLDDFLVFMVLLFVLAAFFRQDYIFTVLYLFTGAYILGNLWKRKSLANLAYKRTFPNRVFINEEVQIQLEVKNTGWLPVIWLKMSDSLPVDLSIQKEFKQVFNLGPYESKKFGYRLQARKRGYYHVGPLVALSSDLLGLSEEQHHQVEPDYLIIYPKIIPLTKIKVPSNSPMGTLRHHQHMYEDPSRVLSKRDYTAGDSLRRIDWKSSASVGRLQVKQFEPSIALETVIFLNLNSSEYELKTRFDGTELAIVVAASIANWIVQHKQSVGLITNGLDPLKYEEENGRLEPVEIGIPIQPIPARKGRGHLIRILDTLARVQTGESTPLVDLLRKETIHLPWGTTMILISETLDTQAFDHLFQVRQAGMNVMLILTGQGKRIHEISQQSKYFHFPLYNISSERDIDLWRR